MRATAAELQVLHDGAPRVRASAALLEALVSVAERPSSPPPLQLRRLRLARGLT